MARSTFQVPDGRRLDLWVEGPVDGVPLVFHMGTPSSGLPWEPMVRTITERGLRYVSWSRPGYGDSSPHPGRTVASVVDDTAVILDALEADRAYVMGWSGGGPHAIACAALLPDRVVNATTIASAAPYPAEGLDYFDGMGQENIDSFNAQMAGPESHIASFEEIWPVMRDVTPEAVADALGDLIDDVDRAALTGDLATFLAATTHEGLREHTAAGTRTTSCSSSRGGSTWARSADRSTSGRAAMIGWCRSPTASGSLRTSRPRAPISIPSTVI